MLKRLFDIIFSSIGLILASPLMLLVGLAVKTNSPGPVFYQSERVGQHGKKFKLHKFRTMTVDAEKANIWSTAADDSRITKIGHFLRKYNLDELPQLFNVLMGQMSLVGPRPQVSWAVELYNKEEREIILSVKPGLTDLASLKFLNEAEILKGSQDPDKDYLLKIDPEKRRLNIEYVKNHSLWIDIKIIFKTIFKIINS